MMTEYYFNSGAYLSRARSHIISKRKDAMFYAALELRFCVEKRQEEYLKAAEEYSLNRQIPWEISKKRKLLKNLFDHNSIAKVDFAFPNGERYTAYHIPVNENTSNNAEKLGNYLHCINNDKAINEDWWKGFYQQLIVTYRGIWAACQSRLMHPLYEGDKNLSNIRMIFPSEAEKNFFTSRSLLMNRGTIDVNYLDKIPKDLVCDL